MKLQAFTKLKHSRTPRDSRLCASLNSRIAQAKLTLTSAQRRLQDSIRSIVNDTRCGSVHAIYCLKRPGTTDTTSARVANIMTKLAALARHRTKVSAPLQRLGGKLRCGNEGGETHISKFNPAVSNKNSTWRTVVKLKRMHFTNESEDRQGGIRPEGKMRRHRRTGVGQTN